MTSEAQPAPPTGTDKALWRAWARARRARLAADRPGAEAAAAAVARRLADWPVWRQAHRALVYLPLGSELALRPPPGPALVVPRIVPGPERALSLHLLDGAQLEVTDWGLRQPVAGTPMVDADDIDLVLVPGLAFDLHGGRLGYGGGYYDRLLARARLPEQAPWVTVGIGWDELVVEALPSEPHDRRLDCLLTPARLRSFVA